MTGRTAPVPAAPASARRATSIASARAAAFAVTAFLALPGCRPKASAAECDALLDRYAGLVVAQRYPDASAAEIEAERRREKSEARADDAFKNCSSEVSRQEFECAMRAESADAFEKCLE